MKDAQYSKFKYQGFEIEHLYGNNVHIVSSPFLLSLIAKLGHPNTKQPTVTHLINQIYDNLFQEVVNTCLPIKEQNVETRMSAAVGEKGFYHGPMIDDQTPVVCVDLARAGTVPSQNFYEKFNFIVNPDLVRQDHFYVNRVTNDKGEVTGVSVAGSKIGGPVDDAIVIFPDPMGATGSTIVRAYNHYKNEVEGVVKKFIAVHMIVTPEYVKRVTKECPDLIIIAARLDRGLSSDKVLVSIPGTHADEKGLTEIDYIVPGAGGIGEILNNAFV